MNNFYTYIVIQCEKNSLSLSLSLNFFFVFTCTPPAYITQKLITTSYLYTALSLSSLVFAASPSPSDEADDRRSSGVVVVVVVGPLVAAALISGRGICMRT